MGIDGYGNRGDLEETLRQLRAPVQPPPMPPAALPVRLRTSAWLRRAVPSRLAVTVGARRARRAWEADAQQREHALAAMEAVVGGTHRGHEAAVLARAHLVENEICRELFWQPWRPALTDAESRRRLDAALATGRGVLVSCCHTGPVFLHLEVFAQRGRRTYVLSAPWFFAHPEPGAWGRRIARWWRQVERRNQRVVSTSGAYPVLAELLRQGEVVVVYFDMPGSRSTPFLGKPVMLATGTARLAFDTDALVLPMRARREGARGWADVAEPLDPRTFADHEQLHDAIAALHGRWVLERPEALEDPNRPGAWEGGAHAEGWQRRSSEPAADAGGAPARERAR